jgi:MYXO-CTERM domain-containing protein
MLQRAACSMSSSHDGAANGSGPRRQVRAAAAVLAVAVAFASALASDASAAPCACDACPCWPPPPSVKDMSDPNYWPNDPDYAFSEDSDGQWNYYSFIPSVARSVRPEEKASGMSIDLAWRYTIGDPTVVLAITDSGIKWDEPDLVEKVWLNWRELANHKPTHRDSTPCGGEGDLAGFDCNGDGVFSVGDYAETPTLEPPASEGHPRGDKNANGILDPGDLILNFSDGVDDDGNGYVDDIAGWDFMKDDNDPYDDTRYGHGTGEARDSTAQANNGIQSAGVCPLCRFMPMRVGDSFITNVNSFGKAVIYATDNGARVIQCALGTINMSQFTQKALDYAYENNVLAVTSMADENARHHNVPATANHTLPVHAIQYDGNTIQDASTFFAFHPCSNYGGQNFLSASGTGCSSEATGRFSGIVGLLYSAAQKYKVSPPLTPGEAHSIFFTTTDDINVPESQKEGSPYRWSHQGFDQRFGYGRVNANKAVEAIRAGRIPPSIDITSPTWFTVLYKDQLQGPVDIRGSISAKRASSYDYEVQWAPGVQPLDSAFTTFASGKNGSDIEIKDDVIASLEVRTIDPTHERDPDSARGENDTAITVRIRATAHYGDPVGSVAGEMRRTYYVQSDPGLVRGFPVYLGDSGELSPKMADIDGDGVRDLIVPTAGGELHVYKITPSGPVELPGFPFRTRPEDGLLDPPALADRPSYLAAPAYATQAVDPKLGREPLGVAPGIADLDGDGSPEIVFSTFTGTVYVIDAEGKEKPGWPVRLPEVPSCPTDPLAERPDVCMSEETRIARGTFSAPALVDMNRDGKLDIVQTSFDGKVYVFDHRGRDLDGFPVEIHYKGSLADEPQRNRILTTAAVGDFNDDGIPDILVGSNEQLGSGGNSGAIYLVDGRGNKAPKLLFPNWPLTLTSFQLFPLVAEGVPNSGVIGRFGGTLAAVMHGNASAPLIVPADPGKQPNIGSTPPNAIPEHEDPFTPGRIVHGLDPTSQYGELSKAKSPDVMFPLFAQPSLGDIDQDGTLDVITSGGSLSLATSLQASTASDGQHLLAIWSGKTGAMLPAAPMLLEDFTFFNSQAIADLNGDDYPEVIVGSGGYFLHAFDGCGREPDGWPKFTGQWIIPTPAVGDLDGDGKLEVAIMTRAGWLYAWHTDGKTDGIIEWESFHHDNRNTGNAETPLEQGSKRKAKKPLTKATCEPPVTHDPPVLKAGGGCDCSVASGGGAAPSAACAALAILGLALRRRRRADGATERSAARRR